MLVESPTYRGALAGVRAAGLTPLPVPSDADGIRPELLAEALERTGARVVYLQPLHANPHGADLSAARRAEVLAIAAAAGAFLVEDDWARDLTVDGPAPAPLAADDADGHVVYVRSLSKAASPGLRVAAVAARGPAGARLRAARVVEDLFVSAPLQHAALDLVSSPGWRRHLKGLRAGLRERRDALAGAVERSLGPDALERVPTGGLHLWVRLPDGTDEPSLIAAAARAGVIVSGGGPSFAAEPTGPHLRLTFGGAPPDVLVEGVERLAALLPLGGALELGLRGAHRRVRLGGLLRAAEEQEAHERADGGGDLAQRLGERVAQRRLGTAAHERLDDRCGGGAALAGPRHEELVGVDRLGDRAGEGQVGVGVLGRQIEMRHGTGSRGGGRALAFSNGSQASQLERSRRLNLT